MRTLMIAALLAACGSTSNPPPPSGPATPPAAPPPAPAPAPAPAPDPAPPSMPPPGPPAKPDPTDPSCTMHPDAWCASPAGDPCGAHKDVKSCRADAKCTGMHYSGESVVACKYDPRGFATNCPTVGCVTK